MTVPREEPSERLVACHSCGLIQRAPALPGRSRARCVRCNTVVLDRLHMARSGSRTAAAALAALLLYPFAVGLPIMTIERFGHAKASSIWTGTLEMLGRGEWFVGLVVLACSVVIPLLKLLGLLSITIGGGWFSGHHRAFTYRVIEWTGRWGMLDVLLIAVVVAWVKVGDLVEVTPGPAALTFTLVVVLSLLASAWFDPRAIWEAEDTLETSP